MRAITSACFLLMMGACTAGPAELPNQSVVQLEQGADQYGDLIYSGSVALKPGAPPTFRYVRRVQQTEGGVTASHLTCEASSEQALVLQRATSSVGGSLRSFREIHRQTGRVSTVEVRDDGSASYSVEHGGTVSRRSEGPGAPVVVGPTLFGHVLTNWDALLSGRKLEVRFAAADRGRSYPFELSLASSDLKRTVIRFEASDWIVRLAMKPMFLEFDTASRKIVRYTGRVPPRVDGKDIDAIVDYVQASDTYR
jgi:hypothetical protein